MIQKNSGLTKNGSGKLINLGKLFYFKFATHIVRAESSAKDKVGLYYCREAMMEWGKAEYLEGPEHMPQLFSHWFGVWISVTK